MALLLSRPPTDSGWNQQSFEAVESLAAAGEINLIFAEPVTDADAERIIRRLAEEGRRRVDNRPQLQLRCPDRESLPATFPRLDLPGPAASTECSRQWPTTTTRSISRRIQSGFLPVG